MEVIDLLKVESSKLNQDQFQLQQHFVSKKCDSVSFVRNLVVFVPMSKVQ